MYFSRYPCIVFPSITIEIRFRFNSKFFFFFTFNIIHKWINFKLLVITEHTCYSLNYINLQKIKNFVSYLFAIAKLDVSFDNAIVVHHCGGGGRSQALKDLFLFLITDKAFYFVLFAQRGTRYRESRRALSFLAYSGSRMFFIKK